MLPGNKKEKPRVSIVRRRREGEERKRGAKIETRIESESMKNLIKSELLLQEHGQRKNSGDMSVMWRSARLSMYLCGFAPQSVQTDLPRHLQHTGSLHL